MPLFKHNRSPVVKWLGLLFVLFCVIKPLNATAQQDYLSTLNKACNTASNDSQRVASLGNLARYYFAIREDEVGDSILKQQMMYAHQTGNKQLVLHVLFNNPRYTMLGSITRSPTCVTKDATQKNLEYINESLAFAKEESREDYVALAYNNLSNLYIWQGQYSNAFKYANLGYTSALSAHNDSVKVVCGLQLGYTYLQQREVLMSYKTYSNAYDIASHLQNPYLLSTVYHYFCGLYKKLGQMEKAKEYANKSLVINQGVHNYKGIVNDFLSLGKLYDYNDYITRAEKLATVLNDVQSKIDAEKLLFSYNMYVLHDPKKTIAYLETHPLLKKVLEKIGPNYIDWIMGEVYLYGDSSRTALAYYKKAEGAFNTKYNTDTRQRFVAEFAACYKDLDSTSRAIEYYKKSLELSLVTSNMDFIMEYAYNLSALYEKQHDYEEAYHYSTLYNRYKDTVNILSKEKDLALMEIDSENKKRLKDAELALQARERRDNLQYMGITVAIASIFLLLIWVGMFRVSEVSIRIIGFFAFIFFFEFIILIADNKIHAMTHGEPYKVWIIKIILLSLLLPLHHKLEEKAKEYLISKKLVALRQKMTWWKPTKKAASRHPEKEKE